MKKLFLLYLTLIYCAALNALELNLPVSAVQNAVSGLNLIYPTPASASTNPAICLSGFESSGTCFYSLTDLPFYNLHLAYKSANWGFHLGDAYLDHEFYRENHFSLSGCCSWQNITLGISLRHLHNAVEGYQSGSATLFDAGMTWQNGEFSTALAVHNLTQNSFLESELPILFLWESCWRLSATSLISIGWEKESNFDFSFKFAGRHDLFDLFSIICSYQLEPDRIGAGAVFRLRGINVSYSVRTHQYLDLTHYVSIGYELGK